MRVRRHLTTVIATCSMLGLGLAFALGFSYQMLATQSRSLHDDSGTVRDVAQLAKDSSQWLTTVDLVVGSGQHYLLDGAQALATQLQRSIARIEESEIIAAFPDEWNNVTAGIGTIAELLDESSALPPDGSEEALNDIAARITTNAGPLTASLESLTESTEQLAATRLGDLDMQRSLMHLTACFAAGAYLLVMFGVWRWSRNSLVIPVEVLALESERAVENDTVMEAFDLGPVELRNIASQFTRLGEMLEEKVTNRTCDLETRYEAAEAINMELQQINQVLEALRHEADDAFRAQSEFLADMSHDIRVPTEEILKSCAAHNSGSGPLADDPEFLASVQTNSETLLQAIDDLRVLSSIEARKIEMNYTPCDLEKTVRAAIDEIKPLADERCLAFEVEAEESLPPMIHSDCERLKLVLTNVLRHAIDRTEQGAVRCLIQMVDGQCGPSIAFDVLDSGRGYTPEEASLLFEPFLNGRSPLGMEGQVAPGATASLGLAISRKLAQLLGGDTVLVSSEDGTGTHIRIVVAVDPMGELNTNGTRRPKLPEEIMEGSGEDIELPSLQDLHMMVADLSPTVLTLTAYILAREGVDVEVFDSPELACHEAMLARETERPFDVLLLDMDMPVNGSRDLGEKLRDIGYRGVIIAMISADVDNSDRYQDLGINDIIVKPVQREVLLNKLRYHLVPVAE